MRGLENQKEVFISERNGILLSQNFKKKPSTVSVIIYDGGHRVSQAHTFDSQGLYSSKRSEGALGQGLDLVVIQRQQREILQVLEGVGTDAVDLIGIQQPAGVDK